MSFEQELELFAGDLEIELGQSFMKEYEEWVAAHEHEARDGNTEEPEGIAAPSAAF
jgi:hypothetical protein